MAQENTETVFLGVDFHCELNNTEHRTIEISKEQLVVRRGQPFKLSLKLAKPFSPFLNPLHISAMTGSHPTEEQGTLSFFGLPDKVERSQTAKAVWKIELHNSSSQMKGVLNLVLTPPADAPIGEYILCVTHRGEETILAMPVVLFNPWCPGDWVYMADEEERQEYVMNEQGIVYKGSANYIFSMKWDFGQFEESMVNICMKILDLNHKHLKDPADDVSARCNPIYVSRVVSAMINSQDDRGVLTGRWGGPYYSGVKPSHWSGSHAILMQWLKSDCHPVKYGQCWVFAAVMCSVMRLLGIPCRVVTNFESAHDNDRNLTIDVYHADYGVGERESPDSIWNFHVWTESWMKRPDLSADGKYDGWQVLDPTPQEKSDGVYCCGPAPVKAILDGETDLKYDIPFVFAEVNADCIDWLVKADGTHVNIWSDTKRVGQNISTKSVGSDKRLNITGTYKHKEGSDKERLVFKYACTRDYSRSDDSEMMEVDEEETEEDEETEETITDAGTGESAGSAGTGVSAGSAGTGESAGSAGTGVSAGSAGTGVSAGTTNVTIPPPPPPEVFIELKEVSKPTNGKDVNLNLVLHSESSVARPLSINISVQAMMYNSTSAVKIMSEVKEETLQPGADLSIPIAVPFRTYHKPMVDCDSMKISVIITDKHNKQTYLAESDVVLLDPPISISLLTQDIRLSQEGRGQVLFMNPAKETLKNCTLTLSGSGLWKEDNVHKIPDMKPNTRIIVTFFFIPYKTGQKTIMVDFDCATFRDIKGSLTVNVKP